MAQSEQQKIRSRLRRYERALQKEKKEYGYYHDGAGKRYQIGPHYMLLGDDEGALAAFEWFEKEFSDDVGEPGHLLCWSLALHRAGNEVGAAKKLRQAIGKPDGTHPVSRLGSGLNFKPLPCSPASHPLHTQRVGSD